LRTGIGRSLHGRRARVAAALGASAVVVDLGVVWLDRYPESIDGRWAVALTALVAHTWLSGGDLPRPWGCGARPAGGGSGSGLPRCSGS